MTTNRKPNRNIIELEEIREEVTDINDLRRKMNESIVQLNYILRGLTLSNMDGETLEAIIIPANTTKRVSHRLRLIPKYRIILKQEGGGTILDGAYTPNYIELENTGASEAKLSIIIVKE